MLEARSPIGPNAKFEIAGLVLGEAPGFELTQLAGEEKALKRALGDLPDFGQAIGTKDQTVMRISPSQVWVLGNLPKTNGLHATPLSSSRTRIAVEGEKARALLLACAAVDFDASTFKSGHFVMTGIHHTPVLIHCRKPNQFHIYAMRSFALSVWEWLVDAARTA
jgi:heterotetrameric sarcosine oxidase gamma subunit